MAWCQVMMGGGDMHIGASLPRTFSILFLLFLFYLLFSPAYAKDKNSSSSSASWKFSPDDNYLINCGSPQSTKLEDGRTFKSDPESASYLSTNEDVQTNVNSISVSDSSAMSLTLYLSARIFPDGSTYSFFIARPGRHWIRLYFYPLLHPLYDLTSAIFTVSTDKVVLLHDFSAKDNATLVFKEYLVNISSNRASLKFSPKKKSFAFINAIEFVSAPDSLIPDLASVVSPWGFQWLVQL